MCRYYRPPDSFCSTLILSVDLRVWAKASPFSGGYSSSLSLIPQFHIDCLLVVPILKVIIGLCNLKWVGDILISSLKSSFNAPLWKSKFPVPYHKALHHSPYTPLWPHHYYLQRAFQTLKWHGFSSDFSKRQAHSRLRHLQAIYSVQKIGPQLLAWMCLSLLSPHSLRRFPCAAFSSSV